MKNKSNKAKMPENHWEKDQGQVLVSDLRYASKDTMQNPEDLKKSVNALSSFVKSHKMKY